MRVLTPHRGTAADHPPGLVLPPRRLFRDGRPLKAWRYAGLYTDRVMLCAGRVSIGGVPQRFWAVWDRERGELRERTRLGAGLVRIGDDRLTLRDRGVDVDLTLRAFGDPVEVVSPHGDSFIWTRKWLAHAKGEIRIGGRSIAVQAPLLVDDSAGYHARATDWEWAAGVGATTDGVAVVWNLVTGINDAPHDSERTVWADGAATEVQRVEFAPGLNAVTGSGAERLEFSAEATRERHDRLGLVRSDYIQPFGTFTGTLPGGLALASGYGVMERHSARW